MRVLVVEDEKQISDLLKTTLAAESFAVDVAEDGEQGSFMALTNDYDLVILDIGLPKLNGLEVCKRIREGGKTAPIIMLSVQSGTDTKVKFFNAGADDYITKPFSLEELMARVRAVMRRQTTLQGDVLSVDNLMLDVKKHLVTREGNEIYLTRKEFGLLEYLMRNQGSLLTRSMIMEHVWDQSTDPFSNTIEAHILSLRKKIDTGYETTLIQTVPARGYKLQYNPKTVKVT